MNDLDKILDKLCEDPAFVRAYREERITWELQARAVCRYLRGEVERLAEERNQLQVELNGANISILALLNASAHVDEELERIANE